METTKEQVKEDLFGTLNDLRKDVSSVEGIMLFHIANILIEIRNRIKSDVI